jgi:hypothetical protein
MSESEVQRLAPKRKEFASELERGYLKSGMDVTVRVTGGSSTTLQIQYVLMSRPMVYKIANETNFLARCRDLGFKVVVFTDGFDATWRYDVIKDKFY